MTKVTKTQAEFVLNEVAVWLGKRGLGDVECKEGRQLNYSLSHVDDGSPCDDYKVGPAPTGQQAAYRGLGPELRFDWDYPGKPTPTVILESGYAPDEWAIECSLDIQRAVDAKGYKIYVEPYFSFALSIYPA